MALVRFIPGDILIEVEKGATILEAARRAGIVIESPCNGTGKCGKCKVRLAWDSLPHINRHGGRSIEDSNERVVLACDTGITDDISVGLISGDCEQSLKILSHGEGFEAKHDPYIRKVFVPDEGTTYVCAGDALLGIEPGNTRDSSYGIVVDIGTTTIVLSLVDLATGREVAATSSLNPQAMYAQDVLSRIRFASEADGLDTLHGEFIRETNRLIDIVTAQTGVRKENVYEVIYSGNTCMLHLATNTNPVTLGRYPYHPAISGGESLPAEAQGLDISSFGIVYLPPIISGFVGADITSGVLATRLHERKGTTLFVDVGTNGEMVLAREGTLLASSTAAGPAFEGMNITFGVRAENGALERFEINENGEISIRAIGNNGVSGICGSGVIDVIGELVSHHAIERSGRFADPARENSVPVVLKERLRKKDGKPVFFLTSNVYLSQKDVRQVQLAKSALRTGIEFLLLHAGVTAAQVDSVLIAGSFGYHLKERSLVNIGLLPPEFAGKIGFVGNTSKSGGHLFLTSQGYREEMSQVTARIEVIELAKYRDFERVFIKNMGF